MNTGIPPADWDKQLTKLDGSILQSRPWAQFQDALGRKVVWDHGKSWSWTGAVRESKGLRYLLCSYGPTAADTRSAVTATRSLLQAGERLGVDFVRVEPRKHPTATQLQKLKGRRIHQFNAERTRVLDLTKSEEDLRQALASGHRNLINGTERRGITISRVNALDNLDLFMNMLDDTAQRSGVSFFARSYFQAMFETLAGHAAMYVAEAQEQPVAAAVVYDWGGTRYYAHAGAFQDLNRQAKASVSLVWHTISEAKAAGLKRYDLWGIAPEDQPGHSLAGISKFKNAFGGESVDYVGTWDIPLRPMKYQLYALYRKVRGMDR